MANAAENTPIFIHSLFRSGSTYMFKVFRRSDDNYWCYQEPENEALISLNSNAELLLDYADETANSLRHPLMDRPYFWEFYQVKDGLRGLFKKSFSYDNFFVGENSSIDADQLKYFEALVSLSKGRPVLQLCRGSGRAVALKKHFGGIHIHLWRNPRSQWWSYKINNYFDSALLLFYQSSNLPDCLRRIKSRLNIANFHSENISEEFEFFKRQALSSRDNYFLFYAFWVYSFVEHNKCSDIVVNLERLGSDERARADFESGLADLGVRGLSFFDCSMLPIGFSSEEKEFFSDVEQDVLRVFKSCGLSQCDIDLILRCGDISQGSVSVEAVNSRAVALRLMDEKSQFLLQYPNDNFVRSGREFFQTGEDLQGGDPGWKRSNLGPESRKSHARRLRDGFFDRYLNGVVLDVGYRGYEDIDVVPVLPHAIGIDLSYPGYDGKTLPFGDNSVDAVYTSHTLEHIDDPVCAIREWYRVLCVGGYLVITVPHQFLYEKRACLPSRWNLDHKRFYTPSLLMQEIEMALPPNSYRVRHLIDDDEGYDYSIKPDVHAGGGYQIELVIQKIREPVWELDGAGCDPAPLSASFVGKIHPSYIREIGNILSQQEDETRSNVIFMVETINGLLSDVYSDLRKLTSGVDVLESSVGGLSRDVDFRGFIDCDGGRHLKDAICEKIAYLKVNSKAASGKIDLLLNGLAEFISEQKK